MTEPEWEELLPLLRKSAQVLFSGIAGPSDWEDAVQHACLVICSTPDVLFPKAFAEVVMQRWRRTILDSEDYRRRSREPFDFDEIPVRAGFDAELLASEWMEKARRRIPAIYREAARDFDSMAYENHGTIKGRPRLQSQKMWRVRSLMRAALAKVA